MHALLVQLHQKYVKNLYYARKHTPHPNVKAAEK